MGRFQKKIDWVRVDKLLKAHCSGVGIASILGVHENTLYAKCEKDKGISFDNYKQLKRSEGLELLREAQFDLALNQDRTMLIWLGKQFLGQSDKINSQTEDLTKTPRPIIVQTQEEADKINIARVLINSEPE